MDFYIISHQNKIKQIIKKYFNEKINLPNCGIIHIYQNKMKILYPNNNIEYKNNLLILPYNINIYLIRHAQAKHNVMSKFKRIFTWYSDPSITNEGFNQINILINFIKNNYFDKNKNNIFCSSDLYRTQQTAYKLMKGLNEKKKILILPNISEIIFENEILNNSIYHLIPENKSLYRKINYLNWYFYNNYQNEK
jgi:hypothetical protein